MKIPMEGKRATIRDVAAGAGVSKSTVSRVLAGNGKYSEVTRRRIHMEAQRLRFEPDPTARRLSSGRFESTVALFTLILDLNVGTQKIRRIQDLLTGMGLEVPIYAAGSATLTPNAMIDVLRRQRPRAIIVHNVGMAPDTLQELERYRAEGGILISYDMPIGIDCDRVIFDREDNTYQATRHLLELGHRDIGFCSPGPVPPVGTRVDGFRRALNEFGVPVRREWFIGTTAPDTLYELAGEDMALQFLKLKKRPTAVCVGGDYAAVCFGATLERAGISVPGDVSVVGHDDSPIARCGPLPLTTVTHPVDEITSRTVALLTDRIEGYVGPAREVIIGSHLVVRASSAPPRGSACRQ